MDEELYKAIIDALPQAILVLDEHMKVVMSNRGFLSLLSKSAEEIEGREIGEVIPHMALQDRAREVQKLGWGRKEVELHLHLEDGPHILRAIIVPLNGPLSLLALEDVSEKVKLEEQLVQWEKSAGMGQLASTIAHELGNPLSIISSTLQYIQKNLSDERDRSLVEALEVIMDNIHRMHELLESLSEFTRPARPRFEYADLHHLLSQVLAFISKEAEGHNIRLYTEFHNPMPRCQVDVRRMKQVFLNLFKNAIEAMPEGGSLTVKTRLAEGQDEAIIEVWDTGVGIVETELSSIFRPFYSTKAGGMGLGLSLCRQVIEEHGGEISVRSEPGTGTCFTLSLPITRGREDEPYPDRPGDR